MCLNPIPKRIGFNKIFLYKPNEFNSKSLLSMVFAIFSIASLIELNSNIA